MADTIIWPAHLLKPQTVSVDIAHRNLRSSSAANGFTQVVSNSSGVWKVSYGEIPVYSSQMIKAWRAIDTLAEGQMTPISIPIYDYPRSPASTSDLGKELWDFYNQDQPHSDDSFFDDGSGYVSTYTLVNTSSTVGVGSVTIPVIKSAPYLPLEPGQRFSINDKLYQIQKVTSQTDTTATLVVRPPVREFIGLAERLEFDMPRIRVRLLSDTAMYLPLNYNRHSFPPLDFIEDV